MSSLLVVLLGLLVAQEVPADNILVRLPLERVAPAALLGLLGRLVMAAQLTFRFRRWQNSVAPTSMLTVVLAVLAVLAALAEWVECRVEQADPAAMAPLAAMAAQ